MKFVIDKDESERNLRSTFTVQKCGYVYRDIKKKIKNKYYIVKPIRHSSFRSEPLKSSGGIGLPVHPSPHDHATGQKTVTDEKKK